MSQPDQLSQDIEISEAEASTDAISSDQTSTKQVEDKRLTELNGEIGYYVKKGTHFVPLTNFCVICTGYVAESPTSSSSDGFLFQVLPKNTIASGEDDNHQENCTHYYLTWRDMSTQTGILSKFDSKKLWTVPSKDQYLPAYFKRLCDHYLTESNPRRVYPVECVGLQQNSSPPTWVIGSNFHVQLENGICQRLFPGQTPYAVLGSELAPLPFINIQDENLDGGQALKKVIEIESLYMGDNFAPGLLIIGGLGMVLHYQELNALYDGVPLVMAYGLPVSGKSLSVQIAMALIGEVQSVGECTLAGILKLTCSRALQFWWDDVSDFNTLEALVVQTFNQILEKLELKHHFLAVKEYFIEHIIPVVHKLLEAEDSTAVNIDVYDQAEEEEYMSLITTIVTESSAQPQEARKFFISKTSMKSKCKCGDVFGFKIIEALRLIGEPEREQALRRFVTSTKRGCAGRLTFPGTGQVSGCIHIQRMQLPESVLKSMDKAFSSTRNAPTPCNGSSMNVKHVNAAQAMPVITISENIAVSDQMPGEADPQQVEETNIELQVNANSQGNTTQSSFMCTNVPSGSSEVVEVQVNSVQPLQVISGDSDEEKQALDEEILARAAEQAEQAGTGVYAEAHSTQPKKTNRKGRSNVNNLLDNLHPGTITGKRRRTKK